MRNEHFHCSQSRMAVCLWWTILPLLLVAAPAKSDDLPAGSLLQHNGTRTTIPLIKYLLSQEIQRYSFVFSASFCSTFQPVTHSNGTASNKIPSEGALMCPTIPHYLLLKMMIIVYIIHAVPSPAGPRDLTMSHPLVTAPPAMRQSKEP